MPSNVVTYSALPVDYELLRGMVDTPTGSLDPHIVQGQGESEGQPTNTTMTGNSGTDDITERGIDGSVARIYQVLVPVIFSIIVVIGVLGNFLVIYVIASRKRLQTVTNLLLMNLAISDVCFLLICGSFVAVHYVLTEWPLGDVLCRIVQYLLYVSAYVTVYTLIAVSAVRYVTVVHGSKSAFIHSKRNIIFLILAIWVVFLVAKIPVLIVHGVSHSKYTGRTECIISGRPEAQQLFASFFVFAYALPLAVIATLYIMLVYHIRHKGMSSSPSGEDRKRHVTKVLVVVVTVFALCWLPLHIHLLVAYYGQLPETIVYKVLLIVWHSLAFMNSLLNPIIYNFCSQDFRLSFKEVVTCTQPPVDV